MEYRAVKNRCAVNLNSLHLPMSHQEAMEILIKQGFKLINVDLIELARKCIKTSRYRRGATPSEAPSIVDCSSLVKWLYAQCGIWLPRRSIQQREYGQIVALDEIKKNDVIFVSGKINYYDHNPADGVGHVGIATREKTVIHAANQKSGIVETALGDFTNVENFRGVRRYIPNNSRMITLETPAYREVETVDDIRWIILQSLPQ